MADDAAMLTSQGTPYKVGHTLKSSFLNFCSVKFSSTWMPDVLNRKCQFWNRKYSCLKVGGVRVILFFKVQKREFETGPRGFRGSDTNLTCEKVTVTPTLSLKTAESTHPENTRHFCKNRPHEITAQAWELLFSSQNWVQETACFSCFRTVTTYRENPFLTRLSKKHESLRLALRRVLKPWF